MSKLAIAGFRITRDDGSTVMAQTMGFMAAPEPMCICVIVDDGPDRGKIEAVPLSKLRAELVSAGTVAVPQRAPLVPRGGR